MDITVCGKTYANVMGVKATDKDGNEVVFSTGSGDFALANVTVTNATEGDCLFYEIPHYAVVDGDKVVNADPISIESGETVTVSVVYPVGGYAEAFNSGYEAEVTGDVNYIDGSYLIVSGDGTITITGTPR